MATRDAPFATMKTSELLRRAASQLEVSPLTIDHQIAAELRVRARWIEVARHDTGVPQERRLAVASIEDGPRS